MIGEAILEPVSLAHGVVLCAVAGPFLIVGEMAGHAEILPDLLDYAETVCCSSILFHTSRKGLFVKALDVTNRNEKWAAPHIVGYIVEVKREDG